MILDLVRQPISPPVFQVFMECRLKNTFIKNKLKLLHQSFRFNDEHNVLSKWKEIMSYLLC
jgi:hypothetical protein